MTFFLLIKNEIAKELHTTLSYRFQWIGELLGVSIFYFYLSYLSINRGFSFDSYSIWFFSIMLIGDLSGKIAGELIQGTFEQNYLSVFSIKEIFISKIVASTTRVISIILILQTLHYTVTSDFIHLKSYATMLCILPSLVGISFILSGFTLVLKDIGWLINIINNSLLFLSGVFFASELFPEWLVKISFFFPTRLAQILYNITSYKDFPLTMYILQSLIYPLIGCAAVYLCERRARNQGITAYF